MRRLTAAAILTCVLLAWLAGAPAIAQESPLPVWVPNDNCGGMVMAPDECHVVMQVYYFPMVTR